MERLEQQINEAQAVLERLKAEREQLIQQEQHEEIERLEEHLENAQIHLRDLVALGEEAWEELKVAIEQALHQLSESIKKLMH